MEETRPMHKMIPEEEFAAFLEVHPPKMLLSQVGYAYCAEGMHVAEREARLKRLEDAARQKHATQKELESWQGQREFFDFNWDFNPDSVRNLARRAALASSPLQIIADVEPRVAEYLCEPYLPRGMITILAGVAGQGKTTLALWLASQVSNGSLMPDGEPGTVFYFTVENDESIVLRPRLEAMGANLEKIVIQRSGAPQTTLGDPALAEMTSLYGYKPDLIVFDPVQSYLGRKCDMNRTDDVRRVMDQLNKVVRTTNAAALLICHIRKVPMGFNGRPTDLINGSSDFVNVARSVCFLGRDPDHPDTCVVAQDKNSLGLPGASLAFTIGSDGALNWSDEDCDLNAQQIMTYSDEKRQHAERPGEKAKRVLREILEENGRMSSGEIITQCAARGVSRATLYRVRDELDIQEERSGKATFWSLPGVQNVSQIPMQEKNEK